MNLIDILPPREIFDSRTFYDGVWSISGFPRNANDDMLAINAKKENGKNLYMEFLKKIYFEPLSDLCQITRISFFHPDLSFGDNPKTGKRDLFFSVPVFASQLLHTIMDNVNEEFMLMLDNIKSDEDIINFIRDKVRIDMRKYLNVKNNGRNSEYYQQVYQSYLDFLGTFSKHIGFDEFLTKRAQGESNLLMGLRDYKRIFEKKIDRDALIDCFDYDKLCLIMAKTNLAECLNIERQTGKVYNIAHYLQLYSIAIGEMKKINPNYQCIIQYPDSKGKLCSYSSEDLLKEYNALLVRHPEFSFTFVDYKACKEQLKKLGFDDKFVDSFDPSTEQGRKILTVLVDKERGKEVSADWTFIPRGVNDNYSEMPDEQNSTSPGIHYPNQHLSDDEVIRRMLESRQLLLNSGWIYRVYGIEKFEGYEGFIYPNGNVIFEKFYENIETKEVARSSATYIMNIYNFIDLSKLSKPEIIHLINSSNNPGVKRVYHVKDMNRWKVKIIGYVTGSYNEDVIEHVNGLINAGTLQKDGGKKNGHN